MSAVTRLLANLVCSMLMLFTAHNSLALVVTDAVDLSQARAEIQEKKRILRESIVKLQEDYRLKADYLGWITKNGPVTTWPADLYPLQEELYRRWSQRNASFYMTKEKAPHLPPPGSEDRQSQLNQIKDTILNEVAWTTVGPALTALGGLVALVPAAGNPVGLGIDLVKMIGEAVGEHTIVTKDNAKELLEKYQPKVGNLSPAAIKQLLSDLYWKQSAEIMTELRTLNATSQSSQATSGRPTVDLVSFDATSGSLTFSSDFITGVGASTVDGMVGANVVLPQFKYMGVTTWGQPIMAFAALDSAAEIVKSGDSPVQVFTEVPTLLFFPDENLFAGIMPYFVNVFDTTGLAAQLSQAWDSSDPLFPFISITPDINFWEGTKGLTQNATSGFQNNLLAIGYRVAEPSVLLLMGAAIGAMLVAQRRR